MEEVITERLLIRRMAVGDLRDFLAYQTHPGNRRYQTIEPMSEEKAEQYLAQQATMVNVETGGWVAFGVELRREKRLIGEIGIYLPPPPQHQGDIGWSIHPDYQGNGYATEAAGVLLRYAFEERNLHRVTANSDARNVASTRLMQRLGMRHEGHFVQSQLVEGIWQDACQYAMLRREWLSRQQGK